MKKLLLTIILATTFSIVAPITALAKEVTLLNVSYDPTRELYVDYNAAFSKYWQAKTGDTVKVNQSHGGSGTGATYSTSGNQIKDRPDERSLIGRLQLAF